MDTTGQSIGAEICVHPDFPLPDQRRICAHRQPDGDRNSHLRARRGTDLVFGYGQLCRSRRRHCFADWSSSPLTVVAPGGAQTVAWDGPGTELQLTGPATLIARGEAF